MVALRQVRRKLVRLAAQPLKRLELVAEAAVLLVGIKAITTFLPYRVWRSWVELADLSDAGALSRAEVSDVVWAVGGVAGQVPKTFTCLPQALAARAMLQRRGCTAALRIGVSLESDFAAHAWLELDNEVLVGDAPALGQYSVLLEWPSHRRSVVRTNGTHQSADNEHRGGDTQQSSCGR